MNQTKGHSNSIDFEIVALAAIFLLFVYSLLQHHFIFPEHWFPGQFTALVFTLIFCIWILSEIANNAWSKKNAIAANKDKGSFKVIVAMVWLAILAVFAFRSFDVGTFSGITQYVGLCIFVAGIVLREWAVIVLGKHFNVRVQVHEKARLVMEGPYHYIRHPAYTGTLLIFIGIGLSIGTWLGAIVALAIAWIAHGYRIRIEEVALREAFGADFEVYKRRTWKLFPGF